ncbi:MAG: GNAT family N-acetyltransferase [Flavisolibacter sp.]|nr:GNAT family N-acetyltransferase [Flavisolibacter sp.]
MYIATIVTTPAELQQIHVLNAQNLRQNLTSEEQNKEGFVSWLYPIDLLEQMHRLAPSVIVKEDEKVVGYALTTLIEASAFHPGLQAMFHNLESVRYKGYPLFSYRFYCMGQICVAREHRGRGLFKSLYQKHREIYSPHYDFILTEISIHNRRSQIAHENVGFSTIYTYKDVMDEWNMVVWDWR